MKFKVLAFAIGLIASPAFAADLPAVVTKGPAYSPYQYPTGSGLYYGVNTMGTSTSIENSAVGTQVVQGAIGLTVGYTFSIGQGGGFAFIDGMFDFANLNGSNNGFNPTGPAQFEQRFGFGAPVNLLIGLIPGLSSLQNAVPGLIPLPSGVSVNTSSPYLYFGLHEDDTGVSVGLAANKAYLISEAIGVGTKVRLSNGVVFDPFAEYTFSSSSLCLGIASGCVNRGTGVRVGTALEF
jgi:hypothetical protein